MKNILLTGGAGFVGSHAVDYLLKKTDWHITVLDGLNYAGKLKRLNHVLNTRDGWDRVNFIYHDIRAPFDSIDHQIKCRWPNYVIHMAAESHVDRSIDNPRLFYETNVGGTFNILDYFKNNSWSSNNWGSPYNLPCPKMIYISTDEVYGDANHGELWKESDRLNPRNPYAAGKAGGEMFAMSYSNTYGMPITITRTMNIIGEFQDVEKFIPKTIRAIYKGEQVIVHGSKDGEIGSRFYLHAQNQVDALKFILENDFKESIFNVVGEIELRNDIVVHMIGKIMNAKPDITWIPLELSRAGHDKRYAIDGSLLKSKGWIPPVSFEKSMEKIVNWYLQNLDWLEI